MTVTSGVHQNTNMSRRLSLMWAPTRTPENRGEGRLDRLAKMFGLGPTSAKIGQICSDKKRKNTQKSAKDSRRRYLSGFWDKNVRMGASGVQIRSDPDRPRATCEQFLFGQSNRPYLDGAVVTMVTQVSHK